ncbi:glycosyltransferase [Klebsiella quasipneumoniae]|uniref:glycosyltransferase n=1 Tax=Klebsiella quasipneumoniae TaxID=1463165 RepID=UPI0021D86600|nr:glycosyltransferase [Klebsiella quasipneumoniae]MCU8823725.1 glycosyltransferase [Klebsiella quasipneumoniae]
MKNVVFIMPFLGNTGAEKVIFNIVNNLDRTLFKPFLLLYKEDEQRNSLLKDLSPDVTVGYLNINGRIRSALPIFIWRIKQFCKKNRIETLLISDGTSNAAFSPFLPLLGRKIKKIARESNLPSLYEKNRVVNFFYRVFYKNYDTIIVQSNEMYNDIVYNLKIPKGKVIKINNPLDLKYIERLSLEKSEANICNAKINLLTIGRLTYQKGYDILLEAFSKINNDVYHLIIIGDGEERNSLNNLCKTLRLEDKVTFIKNTNNPYSIMKKADLFISSSRWEGYPNVVIEAIACGLPVVANNYPGGIHEILNSDNGVICDLSNELEEGLTKALKLKNVKFNESVIDDIYDKYQQTLL